MRRIGIDMGASSIKLVVLENERIVKVWKENHHGALLKKLLEGLKAIGDDDAVVGISGSSSIILRDYMDHVPYIDTIPSLVKGTAYLVPQGRSVIDIGGTGSRFVSDIQSSAPEFHANDHCAGGTGAFFEDQMERLGMKIEDYSDLVMKAKKVPSISGRCAVFAKTDIIHRQQEGIDTPDILNGLCYALVRNYRAVIMRSLPLIKPVVFTGGVTKNAGMRRALQDVLKLNENELIIPEYAVYATAIGAALSGCETISLKKLAEEINKAPAAVKQSAALPRLHLEEGVSLHDPEKTETIDGNVYLGIDIGSTSTDLVMMDEQNHLIDFWYLRTAGNPEKAVRTGLNNIREKYGPIPFKAIGITGSGRARIGRMIGADVIKDEITAQAEGAVFLVKDVDTVFEIGGQDSKFISIRDGHVVDFQMNKICAAGTGSFVEEQASRMNVPLEEFGKMAMRSEKPSQLGERCTVFIQTSIDSALGKGASVEDISAGLAYSIVRNYLEKVVGGKKVGSKIVLQGGVCYNPSIVAAFEAAYPGRTVVSPYFSISGAYGAAQLAEKAEIVESSFRGYDFDEKIPVSRKESLEVQNNKEFFHCSEKLLLGNYTGKVEPDKKTVGIPYVLLMHHFFPMAYNFFTDLGFNVLLSDPTDQHTIQLSQEKASGETCYPVKLMYGHIQQLIDRKADYIFMPLVHTMRHENSTVQYNYGCMYMQSAAVSIARQLGAEKKGIGLLNPVLDLDMGKEEMAKAMIGVGMQLGFSRPRVMKALMKGAMAFRKYNETVEQQGKEMLASIKPDEKVLVIVTRPYGIADPVLNMQIPDLLLERGQKVITMENLPGHDVDLSMDYPDMYWPFGQHIISAAKMIYKHPNLYAVYLTNHGCGPDTMLMHMFAEEMKDKPYLQIEVDEQYSSVGVITRIEAFLNSISGRKAEVLPENYNILNVDHTKEQLDHKPLKGKTLKIPYAGRYSALLKPWFISEYGINTKIMKPYDAPVIAAGRTITRTKEYLPFAALAGEILKDNDQNSQYFIPSSLGAEADGQYARALRSALNLEGKDNVPLITEPYEHIPLHHEHWQELYFRLMAADLAESADNQDEIFEKALSFETIGEEEIRTLKKTMAVSSSKWIGVVGTPLSETVLSEGVWDRLKAEGKHLKYAPLSEYLLFAWMDDPKVNKTVHKELETMMKFSNEIFGDDMRELFAAADKYLYKVNGGNARYRYAKAVQMSREAAGILLAAPRYENADMVMSMRGIDQICECPVYHVSFDGDWDNGAEERLRSFLYYCG